MRFTGFVIVLERAGWTLQIINKILGNFQRTASLFSHTIYKIFCFGIVSIKLFGEQKESKRKISWLK
jgi:hypothetical protein